MIFIRSSTGHGVCDTEWNFCRILKYTSADMEISGGHIDCACCYSHIAFLVCDLVFVIQVPVDMIYTCDIQWNSYRVNIVFLKHKLHLLTWKMIFIRSSTGHGVWDTEWNFCRILKYTSADMEKFRL